MGEERLQEDMGRDERQKKEREGERNKQGREGGVPSGRKNTSKHTTGGVLDEVLDNWNGKSSSLA